jgi:hypothetical protein
MYEALGDVVSLQYGGSYLTNRIRSYRKNPAWTTKATDMTQNVRRYYSNTMTDAEKQNAINVFLGVFRPSVEKDPIASKNYTTDEYLHNPDKCKPFHINMVLRAPGDKFFDPRHRLFLPLPPRERQKRAINLMRYDTPDGAWLAAFRERHRTFELTKFKESYHFKDLLHSVRCLLTVFRKRLPNPLNTGTKMPCFPLQGFHAKLLRGIQVFIVFL